MHKSISSSGKSTASLKVKEPAWKQAHSGGICHLRFEPSLAMLIMCFLTGSRAAQHCISVLASLILAQIGCNLGAHFSYFTCERQTIRLVNRLI